MLEVPWQFESGETARIWWVVDEPIAPGQSLRYELVAGTPAEAAGVALNDDGETLAVTCAERPVLEYQHHVLAPPAGTNPLYARSGFIHPLHAPSGAVLTRIHPRDHIHHMGIWNPWTSTTFEGRQVDFWNIGSGQGTVRFKEFQAPSAGPVFAEFTAVQEHVVLQGPDAPKVALLEDFTVRVWNICRDGRFFLVDIVSRQRCATDSPLTLNAYRYGGLGFRGTDEWTGVGNYLTSEGKERVDGHGTRARWCAVYGPTSEGPAGVVFLSHPENREHPEPMRIWNDNPMIFFNFCPVQQTEWTLEPGETYTLRYRMLVYDGILGPETADRVWQDLAQPPTVTVERN